MRRALIIIAALVLAGGAAYAGDWHNGSTLRCNQCHNMHSQQSHNLNGGGALEVYPLVHYLLKDEVNELCLSCHDGSNATDVLGPDGGVVRSAGGLNTTIAGFDTTADGYLDWMGHTLGTTADAPGNSDGNYASGDGLSCTDCHQPHGYAGFGTVDVAGAGVSNAWRNLQAQRGFGVSYVSDTNDTTKDVFQVGGAFDYEKDSIQFNEPNTNDSGYGRFCDGCHVDFHGQVGDVNIGGVGVPAEEFVRHPISGVDIGGVGGGHSNFGDFSAHLYRVRVMSPSGVWGAQGSALTDPLAVDMTPSCMSCHRGHGNKKPFGLIYANGTPATPTPITEDGNGGTYSTLCQQCHVQGG